MGHRAASENQNSYGSARVEKSLKNKIKHKNPLHKVIYEYMNEASAAR